MSRQISKAEIHSLLDFADGRSHGRGLAYYEDEAVDQLNVLGTTARAFVNGTNRYRVSVGIKNNEPIFSCSCPVGIRDEFCKHVVALVYAWGEYNANDIDSSVSDEEQQLEKYFESLSKKDLIKIISSSCDKDELLKCSLLVKAAKDNSREKLDVCYVKKFLKKSFETDGFVDYNQAWSFAEKINQSLDLLEQSLDSGCYRECVNLAEYSMKLADETCLSMDDSAGHMSQIFERIEQIHLSACEGAKLDSEELAKRLLQLAWNASFSQFSNCLETHKEVLGQDGLQAFKRLVEEAWEKVPIKMPEERPQLGFISEEYLKRESAIGRSVLEYFMTKFAEASKDTDLLIAVKSKDLSYAHNVALISRICREAGQPEKALEWLDKGFELFLEEMQRRTLRDEAIEVYIELGEVEAALTYAWENWEKHKSVGNYNRIKRISKSESDNSWSIWHEKIHQVLRDELETKNNGGDALVSTLYWENEVEAAWKVAQKHGCREQTWLALAQAREKKYPLEVIPIFERKVEEILRPRISKNYPAAVDEVAHIGRLYHSVKEDTQFLEYYNSLCSKYKRLRNFMKALGDHGEVQRYVE